MKEPFNPYDQPAATILRPKPAPLHIPSTMSDTPEYNARQTTPLLNKAKVKSLALACAQQRARKFTRVSNDFYVGVEAALRNAIVTRVANHPSVGVTLR